MNEQLTLTCIECRKVFKRTVTSDFMEFFTALRAQNDEPELVVGDYCPDCRPQAPTEGDRGFCFWVSTPWSSKETIQ